jgi:DNA-binding CsgD family transcriptional regulator
MGIAKMGIAKMGIDRMLDLELLDALRIEKREDIARAAAALRDAANDLFECRVAATNNIATMVPMRDADDNILATSVFGWDENDRWWRTPGMALKSPLTMACRFESDPFWCNADGFFAKVHNPLLDRIDLDDFERRCFTHAAIVVPVHLPFGLLGAATFQPLDRCKTDLSAEFATFGDLLGLYTRTFIASYQRLSGGAVRLPAGSQLSWHEVECLRWAAIGKTDVEIGMILSRSRATVRFHIHNAATKLNAVNRSQTLFKATQLGYIGLNS